MEVQVPMAAAHPPTKSVIIVPIISLIALMPYFGIAAMKVHRVCMTIRGWVQRAMGARHDDN